MCSCILYNNQSTAKRLLVYYIRFSKSVWWFFFKLMHVFDKKSIYNQKILGISYQVVIVSVFLSKKKNIIFYSIEYFVVYIDVVNLKLKLEIITQQLLTITLTMHLINVISIKALGLSFIGAWSWHELHFFFICSILFVFNAWPKVESQSDKLKFYTATIMTMSFWFNV